jgi:hypothetical protein
LQSRKRPGKRSPFFFFFFFFFFFWKRRHLLLLLLLLLRSFRSPDHGARRMEARRLPVHTSTAFMQERAKRPEETAPMFWNRCLVQAQMRFEFGWHPAVIVKRCGWIEKPGQPPKPVGFFNPKPVAFKIHHDHYPAGEAA